MKLKLTALVAAMTVTGFAQADIIGGQSFNQFIQVGASEVDSREGTHTPGRAGIGLTPMGPQKIDFQGLASYLGTPSDGIYRLQMGSTPPAGTPIDHTNLGTFNFAKVGSGDVWFGEWGQDMSGTRANDGNRAVYYVGDNQGTTMPTGGVATYTVTGLNHGNALGGRLTANFNSNTLRGNVGAINIGARINASNASFAGSAFVIQNGSWNVGTTNGHFFGQNAAALAGIAKFANRKLDTAFGGTKN
ncbi:MAG: Slam-dependent surface lipoprotein [Parashewanella sp.]